MAIKLKFLDEPAIAKLMAQLKMCKPTENRILIISGDEASTASGLIISKNSKDEIIKKGQVVQIGTISEGYISFRKDLSIGDLVTYGMYAGKELILEDDITVPGFTLTVLSLSEIIYIETPSYL